MNRRLVSVLVASVCAGTGLFGSQPASQQAPVFRSGTTVVPLTLTVLDRAGRPITDLKQSEISVTEDDKPREILSFFPQPFTARAATPIAPPSSRAPWLPSVAPQTSRTFLFVLAHERIQYPTKAVDGVMRFVREKLLPQDAVAVLAFNRATDFTTDHERIAQMLERYKREHESIVFKVNEFRVFNRLAAAQPASTQAEIDAVFRGPSTPGDPFRKAADLLLGLDRLGQIKEKPGEQLFGLRDAETVMIRSGIPLTDLIMETSVLKIYAGIEYLRYVDGEKHLVFLGGNIELRSKEDERRMSQRSNDAHVTLDIVRTLGLASPFALEKQWADFAHIQGSQNVSSLTGGMYTGVSMAEKALTAIDQSSRFSYLIGYEPSKAQLDGAFRDVKVKVSRPGVTVLFRHGYFAVEQPDPADLSDAIAQARVESALRIGAESTDIGLEVKAVLDRSGPAQDVVVDLTINASRLVFKETGRNMHTVNIVIGAYVRNARDQIVGMAIGRFTGTIDPPTYRGYREVGIPFSMHVSATGLPHNVKVIVSDYGSALVGTSVARIRNK